MRSINIILVRNLIKIKSVETPDGIPTKPNTKEPKPDGSSNESKDKEPEGYLKLQID